MANLTASLAQDNYKSTLSQAYNGAVGTIYVKNTPTVTFPAGKKVFLTINPEKSNMQVVRVSARDSTLKTITVDSIAVNKGSGSAYAQQSHAVGSKVVISIPYAVWEELDTVTTDKLDINGGNGLYYASTAARDAALGANGVPTTDYRMVRAGSTFYNYNLGTAQRESVDTGTATPAMTTTSLGTGEISTQAETEAQTLTGSVGPLVPTNATINPNNITSASPATGDKISFADVSASNVLRSTTIATMLALGLAIVSNATAAAGSDTTNPTNSFQLKTYFGGTPIAGTGIVVAKNTTSLNSGSTSPTKKYELTIHKTGTYTVAFTLYNATGTPNGYGRIYKDGVAFGTTRSVGAGTTTAFTENLAFTAGNLLQLYLYADSGADSNCTTGLTVSCDMPFLTITTY